jgi:hypothetical protein
VGDPRDEAIINAVREQADQTFLRIASVFGPKHDRARRDNAVLQQRVMELTDLLARLENRINAVEGQIEQLGNLGIEIQRGATHTQILARETWAQTHPDETPPRTPAPLPGAPRPKAIDEACAVSPGEPPQIVRLPRYGATIVPEPGSDPEKVWPDFIASINTPVEGSGTRGLRSSSRTRRR